MSDEEDDRPLEPGPEITRKLFRQWQRARRGESVAEDMTNPVWEWMFRGRIDPYHANERFRSAASKILRTVDFPSEPRWAGCRLGQSKTELADGRVFWIAWEHEDFYDPDFFIYNDVIVEHPDGRLQIIGYPEAVFRPTDFHSATAIEGDSAILIIGSIGYATGRSADCTPVYRLDTRTFDIVEVDTVGKAPGWIHKHSAALSEDGLAVVISGGQVLIDEGDFVENVDDWALQLADRRWVQLTDRRWPRFRVFRDDRESLHLWQYESFELSLRHPEAEFGAPSDLASELGAAPNLEAFKSLYRPSISHELIEGDLENDDAWRTTQLIVDGVKIRILDDMNSLKVTVEGELPEPTLAVLTDELQHKLALVENAPCTVQRMA